MDGRMDGWMAMAVQLGSPASEQAGEQAGGQRVNEGEARQEPSALRC